MGLTACDSELDKTPLDKPSLDTYFRSATDMELYTTSFYSILSATPYSAQSDVRPSRSLSVELKLGSARSTPASGGGWTWDKLRDFNTLLEYAPKNCPDQAVVDEYSGITRFFRAYFYFEKVKRFGDVPWYDKPIGSADEALFNPRDSRELVMTNIIADLDYALENVKNTTGPYKVTKGAVLALKSQACLFEGTFRKYHGINLEGHDYKYYLEQAADAAEKLMSGNYGKYKLYSTGKPDTDYRDLFNLLDANKDEMILAINYNQEPSKCHNALWFSIGSNSQGPGYTRKFINSYLMKDGTRFTDREGWQTMQFADEVKDRDPRLAQTIRTLNYKHIDGTEVEAPDLGVSSTGYQNIKFVTQYLFGQYDAARTDRAINDMPVFRYAEVLLNYAEAKAELGTLTQADLDKSVNLIRKRVGMPNMKVGNTPDPYLLDPNYGYFNVTGANAGDILEIRRERTIELVSEDYRYDDIRRWKCGQCYDQPLLGMYVPGPCELDMTGDGKADYVFYAKGAAKPTVGKGVRALEIGVDIRLSEGTKGYVDMHDNQREGKWDEARDYFYPIPTKELNLNKNLVQNPGWFGAQ